MEAKEFDKQYNRQFGSDGKCYKCGQTYGNHAGFDCLQPQVSSFDSGFKAGEQKVVDFVNKNLLGFCLYDNSIAKEKWQAFLKEVLDG